MSYKKELFDFLQNQLKEKHIVEKIFEDVKNIYRVEYNNFIKNKTEVILSDVCIRELKDEIDWSYISKFQKLSEDFIREFKDKVDWFYISQKQKLSEKFIREFQKEVNWCWISRDQILSEEFIREFEDKVDWKDIYIFQNLSSEFEKEFEYKFRSIDIQNINICKGLKGFNFMLKGI